MTTDLSKKVTLITGAASGIGLALSLVCLQKGQMVIMTDKNQFKLKEEAQTLIASFPDQVFFMACDVTQRNEVEQLAEFVNKQLGSIHWIYNNAGIIGQLGSIWDLEPEKIQQVVNVNLYGMINVIQAFIPLLFKQSFHSHIVNMASLYALCSGSQIAPYSMSKHAVLALSESMYFDLKRLEKPVEVSVVLPSFTDTSLLSKQSNEKQNPFHDSLHSLLSHSRPAIEVAQHIVQEVEKKRFYILPDKEVKDYCDQRNSSIISQENPYKNNVEKLMNSLLKRY